ncbi:Hybrid sensor histidine kinase/response regulator [Sulfidibacter corallicola]|uniref:histidine kinase n=1 Tax=Sulfidibacter corallicola TaxID=2818388 RepID=A0A8A4TGV2_SULCO|nr:hybrid sensor histidine kinase/response regulator [Sulfidibacter corallicola]QTD48747.1 hybrid sensor histidine kinase/response regulator [Sulfidibacter corallicola]
MFPIHTLLLYLCFSGITVERPGRYFLKHYLPEHMYPQTWGTTQDDLGNVIVAASNGVFVFNGIEWRHLSIESDGPYALSIHRAEDGRIYVGGYNGLGYLVRDGFRYRYRSLTESLSLPERPTFRQIASTEEGVYFIGAKILCLVKRELAVESIVPASPIVFATPWRGGLLVQEKSRSPYLLGVDDPDILAALKRIGGEDLTCAFPLDDRGHVFGKANRLYVYRSGRMEPFAVDHAPLLARSGLYRGCALPNGDLALATRSEGVLVFTRAGRLLSKIDRDGGLANAITNLFVDGTGGLWACANSQGLFRIEVNRPVTYFDERSYGGAHFFRKMATFGGDHYFAAMDGLYRAASMNAHPTIDLAPQPGMPPGEDCRYLVPTAGGLLVASRSGFWRVNESGVEKVVDASFGRRIIASRDRANIYFAISSETLHVLNVTETDVREIQRLALPIDPVVLGEDTTGDLWLATDARGVVRVDFADPVAPRVVDVTDPILGSRENCEIFSPQRDLWLQCADTPVIAVGDRGLHPLAWSNPDAAPEWATLMTLDVDADGVYWFNALTEDGQQIVGTIDTERSAFSSEILLRFGSHKLRNVQFFQDPRDRSMWITSSFGLHRYQPNGFPERQRTRTQITQIQVEADWARLSAIPFRHNSLKFSFTNPEYEGEGPLFFRYRLLGSHKSSLREYSPWQPVKYKEYSHLPMGDYVFEVQGRNRWELPAHPTRVPFTILKPWYRTWWAYSAYVAALALLFWSLLSWRTAKTRRYNRQLQHEVMLKTQALEANQRTLEVKNRELVALHQVKEKFFANITHEFRTPLTLCLGPLEEVLEDGRMNPERRRKKLDLAFRNANRLLRLVNQILDLSKIQVDGLALAFQPVEMRAFLTARIALLVEASKKHGVSIHLSGEELVLPISEDKMGIAVDNLLFNALKFTPPGGRIEVDMERRRDSVAILFRDTGIGIVAEDLPHVFSRFYQGSQKALRGVGTGIGLAFTKEIIELHRGTVELSSPEGGGTLVEIRLPLPEAASGQPVRTDGHRMSSEASSNLSRGPSARDMVLVIDDEPDFIDYLTGILEPHYRVVVAASGKQGLARFEAHRPVLTLADVMLPDVSGDEICRIIKRRPGTQHHSVVLTSARGERDLAALADRCRADAYIAKPFRPAELLHLLATILDKANNRRS